MKTNQTYGILFWIKKSKIKNGKAPIYCRITINGKRAEISTKRFTEPEKWSSSSSSIKGKSEEDRTINAHLDNIRSSIHTHYTQLSTLGKFITAETLKNNFLGLEEKERTLIETYEYHNSQMKDLIGIDVVESTLSKYVTVHNKLKPFL